MKPILYFLYFISFSLTISIIIITLMNYIKYKKRIILYWFFFLIIQLLFFISQIIGLYEFLLAYENKLFLTIIHLILFSIANTLLILTTPFFLHELLGLKVNRFTKIIVPAAALSIFIFYTVNFIYYLIHKEKIPYEFYIYAVTLFGIILYSIIFLILNIKNIGDKKLKKVIMVFLFINIFFTPFFFIEIFFARSFHGISLPAYLLVIDVTSLFFIFLYFNKPPYLKKNKLTEYFRGNFKITEREEQIILLSLKGMDYNQIADTLFITFKTVETHIYNIYQKTGVKNRVQLFNLINTNHAN